MTDRERKRLLPGEGLAMRHPRPDDAVLWIDVYRELLGYYRSLKASLAPSELREPFRSEADRINGRISYWRRIAGSEANSSGHR